MAAPILLVADDLSTIASVRRLLGKEGYEVILATSAADALIAFGHHLPAVVLLHPAVESERGQVVLEELQTHPDAALVRVLLLGETVPGFPWPVVPLPPEADTFLPLVQEAMRGGNPGEQWTMHEGAPRLAAPESPATAVAEPEPWRATLPPDDDAEPTHVGPVTPAREPEPAFAAVPESTEFAFGPKLTPEGAEDPDHHAPFQDGPHPDEPAAEAAPGRASSGRKVARSSPGSAQETLERAIALAAAAKLQAREAALARDASQAELAQNAQRLLEERDLDRAEAKKSQALLERLRAELADEKGRGGEARVAAEREHYLGILAEKDRALEAAELDLEAAREEAMARGQDGAKKVDELKQMSRAMEGELERVKRERDVARTALAKGEGLEARLLEAEATAKKAAEVLEQERERAQTAISRTSDENSGLQQLVAQLETALEEQKSRTTDEVARRGEVENTLAASLKHAEALENRTFELESKWNEASAEGSRTAAEVARAEGEVLRRDEALETARAELVAHQRAAEAAAQAHRAELEAQQRDAQAERTEFEAQRARSERDLAEARAESGRALTDAQAQSARALAEAQAALVAQVESLRDEVRQLEARAESAEARALALEERIALPVRVAGKAALMVARAGTVDRARLAELVCQLVLGRNEVRLELGTVDGVRTLWLARGALVAAESQAAGESMVERARRDGLIDGRQEAELRMLRPATPREALEVLKARGYLRQAEQLPLAQRYLEQVALDALSEGSVGYRVSEETCGPEVLHSESPRPVLPLLAEALRRGLAPDALLELLGGGDSVPVSKDSSLDLRLLGFTEKERRLLGYVDGQVTVEELSLVAGMKPDAVFRALLVAKYLGLVEVRPRVEGTSPLDPDLDVKRLLAKFEEVQEADYFTILGVGRAAGTDEVQRSFERLAREFDPIRFSGHSDARLQQQAQVVFRLLEEAARALEDDRRRTEYARHLLD